MILKFAVQPGSANDLGVIPALQPKVKTFLLMNDRGTTRMMNIDHSLKESFGCVLLSQSDEQDVYYNSTKQLTVISVKNCFFPSDCEVEMTPFLNDLLRRAKYYVMIGTMPNPSALEYLKPTSLVTSTTQPGSLSETTNFDRRTYRWPKDAFQEIIVLTGPAYFSSRLDRNKCIEDPNEGQSSRFICGFSTKITQKSFKTFAKAERFIQKERAKSAQLIKKLDSAKFSEENQIHFSKGAVCTKETCK